MAMGKEIPLKTDAVYNPHDFIQTECGTMKELTVTITLAEYRELVRKVEEHIAAESRAWSKVAEKNVHAHKIENENEDLRAEIESLRAEIEQMRRDFTDPLEDWTKEEPDA